MKLSKNSSVLIATFAPWHEGKRLPTNGMVEPFIDYFSNKFNKFVLIEQPHPGSDIVLPIIAWYKKNKIHKNYPNSIFTQCLLPILKFTNKHKTQITFKIRDLMSVLLFVLRGHIKYDLFIGFESINAIAGVILKKIGFIKNVVYYVSDFSPKRYKVRWFNKLYLYLDFIASKYADATWNVSDAMIQARKRIGYDMSTISKQILVPNAFFKKQIEQNPISMVRPHSLVYAGSMGTENGPDLAIKTMPIILKKYPETILTMIGGGSEEEVLALKKLIKNLKIEKNINYIGFVNDNNEMYKIVRKNMLSIAPYKSLKNSVRWYADAVKIRTSFACGVPVITTQVPPNGKFVKQYGAGIVTKDNITDLANAVVKIFSNKNLFLSMRKNAIRFAHNNTWENSFNQGLKEMELIN